MEALKRWISTKAYKRVRIYIFVFIVLFNVTTVVFGGVLLHVLSPESYVNVGLGIWQIFTDILDPGFLSSFAQSNEIGYTKYVEILIVLICMVTFTGAIIGYISNMITSILENSVSGPKRMYLKNHILILNWNNRAAGIISEYLYTEICEDVVVLSTNDRVAVTNEIEDSILELGYGKKQKHVNFVVKQGEPFSYSELDAVCAKQARTIVILVDPNPQDGDLRTLKTVMMVSQMNRGRKDCTIVVETDSQNIYELVNRIQDRKDNNIVSAYLNKLLGKLLAHVALQPQLNTVFAELFSHNGNELYSIPLEQMNDWNVNASEDDIITEFMKKYNHAIPLLTSRSFRNDKSNTLFVLAEKKSEVLKNRDNVRTSVPSVKLKDAFVVPKKIIIILGSNSKLRYMINSFEAYVKNYGEDKLKVYFVDTEENLVHVPDHEYFVKYVIADRYNILEIRKVLKQFSMTEIDTIVILSDDTVSTAEYDSGALISLIDINRELEGICKEQRPEIIVEILNPKNHEIVQQYNIDNVVVSNKYISSMMAQIGDDNSIFELIYDILTFDQEMDDFEQEYSNNPFSKELYIKSCKDYFEEFPLFNSYSDLISAVYSASEHQHIVIGIIYADSTKNKQNKFIFHSDLDEMRCISLCREDKLIIFSSGW